MSGLEISNEEPESKVHIGFAFSLPLPVPFSLLGVSLFLWTLDTEPQEGEAVRICQHQQMPFKQERLRCGLWVSLDQPGSEELVETCGGGNSGSPLGSHGALGPQLGWEPLPGETHTPVSLGKGGCHLGGGNQCVPDLEMTTGPQSSIVTHPCDFHH